MKYFIFSLLDQLVVSVDVTPVVGYNVSGFSLLCPTCCTIIGSYVKFSATVYNPTKCIKAITYTWHFDGGYPSDPLPSLSPSAQSLYSASGNFAYSLTVHAATGILPRHWYLSQVNGTVCIEGLKTRGETIACFVLCSISKLDPVKGLIISAPKQVQKNKEFNITVSCKGRLGNSSSFSAFIFFCYSHPISYCYVTCQHEKEDCTESTKEENVSIPLRFEKSGNCFINITARNNASHAHGLHPIVIQSTYTLRYTFIYSSWLLNYRYKQRS